MKRRASGTLVQETVLRFTASLKVADSRMPMAHRLNQVGDSEEQPRHKEHNRPQRPGGCVYEQEHIGTGCLKR